MASAKSFARVEDAKTDVGIFDCMETFVVTVDVHSYVKFGHIMRD